MNNNQFEVSKELLESFMDKSMKLSEMADTLTEMGGRTCSVATVRMLCKHYKLNLRKKKVQQFFVPTSVSSTEVEEKDSVNMGPNISEAVKDERDILWTKPEYASQ